MSTPRRTPLAGRIRRGVAEPHLAVRQVNRWVHRLRDGLGRTGVEFFDEDWDNLLLLDACRYDVFAERADLPGTLRARQSKASATREFLSVYIDGADLRDTVYVTANPQLYRRRGEIAANFHDVVDVWRDEGWDEDYRTVHPETVAAAAEAAAERHPHKRLLVHFLQPHYPFIGETGQRHLDLGSLVFGPEVVHGDVDVDDELLWRAYRENVDIALSSVRRLLVVLGGRTVVTADHGELLGERVLPLPMREYGHPAGIRAPALNTVPWFVHEHGERRTITREDDDGRRHDEPAVDDAVVEERLRQLGYR